MNAAMTRAEAAAYVAGLSVAEERQLTAFLRVTETPFARPRLLERLRRDGLALVIRDAKEVEF